MHVPAGAIPEEGGPPAAPEPRRPAVPPGHHAQIIGAGAPAHHARLPPVPSAAPTPMAQRNPQQAALAAAAAHYQRQQQQQQQQQQARLPQVPPPAAAPPRPAYQHAAPAPLVAPAYNLGAQPARPAAAGWGAQQQQQQYVQPTPGGASHASRWPGGKPPGVGGHAVAQSESHSAYGAFYNQHGRPGGAARPPQQQNAMDRIRAFAAAKGKPWHGMVAGDAAAAAAAAQQQQQQQQQQQRPLPPGVGGMPRLPAIPQRAPLPAPQQAQRAAPRPAWNFGVGMVAPVPARGQQQQQQQLQQQRPVVVSEVARHPQAAQPWPAARPVGRAY